MLLKEYRLASHTGFICPKVDNSTERHCEERSNPAFENEKIASPNSKARNDDGEKICFPL